MSVAATASADPLCGYSPIHVEMLRRISRAPVDIYVQANRAGMPLLYCRAGLPLENQQLMGLEDAGIRDVYVQECDYQRFGAELLESIEQLLEHDTVPPAERFAALQLALAVEIEHSARLIDCGKFVALSEKAGRDLAAILMGNQVVPRELFRMARHDYHTYAHVTNVASYSVLLAKQCGICAADELAEIATAGMLHDLGKRFIPAAILNKTTRLTPDERDLIEMHPTRGYHDLCQRPEISHAQLMIVYQHHEWVDGTGYPVGVSGDEIHPWARMLAVVDVFDALTGVRPYRKPVSLQAALEYLQRGAGSHFDLEMVQCWASAMNHN